GGGGRRGGALPRGAGLARRGAGRGARARRRVHHAGRRQHRRDRPRSARAAGRVRRGRGRGGAGMNRSVLRWVGVALVAAGATALAADLPRLLRRLEFFRIERVEVVGTRYMAPHEVLALSGITAESSLFDDADTWRAALHARPPLPARRGA